jgi:glycosyltransferase involved in cell wall biosynthesis
MSSSPSYSVLQVLPALDAGGVERTTLEVSDALVQAGHAAHVVSAGGRMVPELLDLGAKHYTMNVGSKRLLSFPWRVAALRRLIHHTKANIVHARSRAPAWAAWRAAIAENVPFVTTYHGIYNEGFPGKRRYNSIMARGDVVIANSSFTADHIQATHKTPASRIVTIPRGVDMDRFDPKVVSTEAVKARRRSWGVPDAAKLVLLPGRLTGWKGGEVAIRALAKLPDDYHLVLLGDAQGRDGFVAKLDALAKELNVPDRIHKPGHDTDMPTAYRAADIVICPSTDPEAFGRTAAEAQAMERPVVASAHGGALSVVNDKKTGYLVPPGNAIALAKAIKACDRLPDVGPVGRTRIEKKFSKRALQAATLRVYARLLGQNAQ